jgi:hypothetical protein
MRHHLRTRLKNNTKLVCAKYFEENYKTSDKHKEDEKVYIHKPTNKEYRVIQKGYMLVRVEEI